MPRSSPNPEPQTDLARRLEYVRAQTGHAESLRAFWTRLTRDWDEDEAVSYEAARRYHWKRDPPVAYLKRVAEVFDVSLEWLITGRGFAWRAYEEVRQGSLREILAETYGDRFGRLPSAAQERFLDVLLKWLGTAPDAPDWVRGIVPEEADEVPHEVVYRAGVLLEILFRPIWRETLPGAHEGQQGTGPAWGVTDPRHVVHERVGRYALRFLDALEEMLPQAGQGWDNWNDFGGSQHQVDYERAEASRKRSGGFGLELRGES